MRRYIIIFLIIAFGGYLALNYYQMKAREAAKQKAEKERIAVFKDKTKAEIATMASSFAAIDNWEDKLLEGDDSGEKRVLTMELEKLWLTGKPILFQGFMRDVSMLKPTAYLVLVDHVPRRGFGKLKLGTSLLLSRMPENHS